MRKSTYNPNRVAIAHRLSDIGEYTDLIGCVVDGAAMSIRGELGHMAPDDASDLATAIERAAPELQRVASIAARMWDVVRDSRRAA
jgi:hypothetical protein